MLLVVVQCQSIVGFRCSFASCVVVGYVLDVLRCGRRCWLTLLFVVYVLCVLLSVGCCLVCDVYCFHGLLYLSIVPLVCLLVCLFVACCMLFVAC